MVREPDKLLRKYEDVLSNQAVKFSSYTLQSLRTLEPILKYLKRHSIDSMMDLGCGYGVLTLIVAEYLGVKRVVAIDIDEQRLALLDKIKSRCPIEVVTLQRDFCVLGDVDERVQLVTSFGALEHTTCWDEFLGNVKRVLVDGGYLLISMPNISSWVNRLALLLGYQPRDIEISRKRLYGELPPFRSHTVAGHVRVATFRAFKEYLIDNGFEIVMARPLYDKQNLLVNMIDKLLPSPSISRRFIILAKKRS